MKKAAKEPSDDDARRAYTATCALAALRLGEPEEAIRWAQDALKEPVAKDDPLRALSHVILALARIELGDTSAARDELATVTEVIDATLPKSEDGQVDPRFVMRSQKLRHEWLIAEILRREAEASLK